MTTQIQNLDAAIGEKRLELDRLERERNDALRALSSAPGDASNTDRLDSIGRHIAVHSGELRDLEAARALLLADQNTTEAQARRAEARAKLKAAKVPAPKYIASAARVDKAIDSLAQAVAEHLTIAQAIGTDVHGFYKLAVPSLERRMQHTGHVNSDLSKSIFNALACRLFHALAPLNAQQVASFSFVQNRADVLESAEADAAKTVERLLGWAEGVALREGIEP